MQVLSAESARVLDLRRMPEHQPQHDQMTLVHLAVKGAGRRSQPRIHRHRRHPDELRDGITREFFMRHDFAQRFGWSLGRFGELRHCGADYAASIRRMATPHEKTPRG